MCIPVSYLKYFITGKPLHKSNYLFINQGPSQIRPTPSANIFVLSTLLLFEGKEEINGCPTYWDINPQYSDLQT